MQDATLSAPPELPAASAVKPLMYHSAHDGAALPATTLLDPRGLAASSAFGSLGRDLTGSVSPGRFLRAHEKTGRTGATEPGEPAPKFERPEVVPRKPAVPSARRAATGAAPSASPASPHSPSGSSTTSSMTSSRRRDFITENAVGAMTAPPRSRAPGEAPNWLARDGFGAVPAYLLRVKAAVAGEAAVKAAAAAAAADAAEAAKGRRLPDDERAELVLGLKQRWDEVNAEYQRVAHKRVSAAGASLLLSEIRFKERCEGDLARLEEDIRRLSAPGPVYVLQNE